MKKIALILFILIFAATFSWAQDTFLYSLDSEEFTYYYQCYTWLKQWESGQIEVSDMEFDLLYQYQIGKDDFTSMLFENFFRNTSNESIKTQLKNYILEKGLSDQPLEKALLKKIDSKKETTEQSGKQIIRYSYNDSEYDENINFFNFSEVHPFDDELGLLLLSNDWQVLTYQSDKNGNKPKEKTLFLIAGGGTNSITITLKEFEDVVINSDEDLIEIAGLNPIANKYKEDWYFFELEKSGVLHNCGVDNYFIGYGIGSDTYVPEIAAGDFLTCMYKQSTGKLYLVDTYMNFSKININYEIRNRLFNYLMFYTFLCFCD